MQTNMEECTEKCPNCKKNVQKANYTVHKAHCQRNVQICSDCEEPVPKCHYATHIATNHSKQKCSLCNEKIEAKMLSTHQNSECENRLVSCSFCEIDVKCCSLREHEEYCGTRTERCKGCTKYVQQQHLKFHYDADHMYLSPQEKDKADEDGTDAEDDECPICLGPVTLPISLECGHVFCMVCVKGIASSTKNCAICRRDINRDMLMDIRFCVEADVIKNYVNNSKKKTPRSKSVPGRLDRTSSRYSKTTRDYDDMVSALLTSRTTSSSYRYERPNNGRTPRSYRPYGFSSTSYRTSTRIPSVDSSSDSSSSSNDEDECCASSSSNSPDQSPTSATRDRVPRSITIPIQQTNSTSINSCTITTTTPVVPTTTRRRPTSLALTSSTSGNTVEKRPSDDGEELQTLTQEEYDRWLAFKLSNAEDDLTPAEFNKRNPMRRSFSMPESQQPRSVNCEDGSCGSPVKENGTSESNGLPPAAPRTNASQTSTGSTRASLLTKSSSDSSATVSTSNANSTGARPKSSSGLKKRVSFKENSPPRRQAPVLLPCEFCNEMFSERDLMRHQTSCDYNETKNPKEFLMSRRSSTVSPLTSPTSDQTMLSLAQLNTSSTAPSSPEEAGAVSNSSSAAQSPVSPTSNNALPSCGPTTKPPASPNRTNTDGSAKNGLTRSPSSRTKLKLMKQSSAQSPTSPQNASFSEGYHSTPNSRNASISPCAEKSAVSSGIGSATSSLSNGSNQSTPASSASASPVPATTTLQPTKKKEAPPPPVTSSVTLSKSDTILTEQEETISANHCEQTKKMEPTAPPITSDSEDTPIPQPRKGKLLCSAISSWRSIASSRPSSRTSNSSSTQFNELVKNSRCSSAPQFENASFSNDKKEEDQIEVSQDRSKDLVILPKKTYKAPSPPKTTITEKSIVNTVTDIQKTTDITVQQSSVQTKCKQFRFDSMPMMNGSVQIKDETSDVSSIKSGDNSEEDSVEYNPFYYCREENEEVVPKFDKSAVVNMNKDIRNMVPVTQHYQLNAVQTTEDIPSTSQSGINSTHTTDQNKEAPRNVGIIVTGKDQSDDCSKQNKGKIRDESCPSSSNSVTEPIELFSCSYCDQMLPKDKLHDHKKACKKNRKKKSEKKNDKSKNSNSESPNVVRRNKKGPAPKPPIETSSDLPVIGRSNSVRERRSDYSDFGGKIERTCSIKETSSRYSRMSEDRTYVSRRWMSRDSIYGGGFDSCGLYDSNSSLSGSTTSLSSLTGGRGWSSHLNMLREDFRSRRSSTSLGLSFPSSPYSGVTFRERSITRSRPSSLYSSRNACNIIADSFTATKEQRNFKRKKRVAPQPPTATKKKFRNIFLFC